MIVRIYKVFIYEFKRNIRRKGFLFTTFGIPALAFVLLFGYQFITQLNAQSQTPEDQENQFDFEGIERAGYVDESGLFLVIPEVLSAVFTRYEDVAAAEAAMQSGSIDVYYVIPADYAEAGSVTMYMPELSINKISSAPLQQLFYSTVASDVPPALLMRLRVPSVVQQFNLAREGQAQDEGADFATVYFFSIVFLLGLFLTNGYLMQSVIEEKETRLIEILISAVRPVQLLAGKIFALGLLGIAQIVVWAAGLILLVRVAAAQSAFADTFIPNVQIPYHVLPVMLLYFVLGYLLFAALYGAVGALSSSMQEGPQYAVIFTIPAVIPYYFFGVFAETPNAALPVALSMFPLTSPLAMMMRLTLSPVPPEQLILSLVLLAAGLAGVMWLAGRLFRVQSLLAGHAPRLREIPRLLRG